MITGQIRSYDFRFGDDFGDFLQSVDRATVTYRVDPVEVDKDLKEMPDVYFNLSPNVGKYVTSLSRKFSSSCDDIENLINDVYIKTDKLYLLSRFIVEIEACKKLITYSPEKGYTHRKYSFVNVSKDEKHQNSILNENDFQEYYYWMEHYLNKMHAFLLQVKDIIEITPQSEFRLPVSMQPDINASSIEKPFAFFDYVFQRNGIAHLRTSFAPSEEDYYHYPYVNWDTNNEVITTEEQDNETGEWKTHTRTFKDHLKNKFYQEFILSRQLFDERVTQIKVVDEIKLFINLSLGLLKHLFKSLDRNVDAKKYDFSSRPIKALIKYLCSRYELFCPDADEIIKEIIEEIVPPAQIQQASPQLALHSVPRGVKLFTTLKKTPEGFTLILHKHLSEKGFIPKDTDEEVILNVFNGSIQEAPLKLKWLDKGKNGKVNKQTLFYLFNRLAAEGLIQEDSDNKTFLQKLNFVFVDGNGEPLQHLKVSNANTGKFKIITPSKNAIDAAIDALKMLE